MEIKNSIQDNPIVKGMLDSIFIEDDIQLDCSDLRSLLRSLNSNDVVLKYASDSVKYAQQPHTSTHLHSKYKYMTQRFAHADSEYAPHRSRGISTNQERIQRAVIMEYCFPGYLEDILLPYIRRNKEPDISRALHSMMAVKHKYRDNPELCKTAYSIKAQSYLALCDIYSRDWKSHFDAVKILVAETKANENQSVPAVSV